MAVSATAAVAGTAKAVASKEVPLNDSLAYRFECHCGAEVVAEVPKEEGATSSVSCRYGHRYSLTWHGDHFTVYREMEYG